MALNAYDGFKNPMGREVSRSEQQLTDDVSQPVSHILFKTTPALKAARTRAWRTYKGYDQEQAEAMSPSNVFVRLKVPTKKLKHSGIPVMKTRWEQRCMRQAGDTSATSAQEHNAIAYFQRDPVDLQLQTNGQRTQMDSAGGGHKVDMLPRAQQDQDRAQTSGPTTNQKEQSKQTDLSPKILEISVQATPNLISISHGSVAQSSHLSDAWALLPSPSTANLANLSSLLTTRQLPHTTISRDQHTQLFQPSPTSRSSTSNPPTRSRVLVKEHTAETVQKHTEPSIKPQFVSLPALASPKRFTDYSSDEDFKRARFETVPDLSASKRAARHLESHELDTAKGTNLAYKSTGAIDHQVAARQTNVTRFNAPDLHYSGGSDPVEDMAPVRDPNSVDAALKDAIQKLYEVQSQVHGFVPETQPLLIDKITELAHSLTNMQTLTSQTLSPNNPIHNNRIAPEVIDYVDDSRNPDIYNREFVELVQRGNAVMNGKQKAFQDFSEIYANVLKEGMPELGEQVDRVMKSSNMKERKTISQTFEGTAANGTRNSDGRAEERTGGDTSTNGARSA